MARTNTKLLRQRLHRDIAELQHAPYPGIEIHLQDHNALQEACLILSPDGEHPLHLTVHFTADYPLSPPHITIESAVTHPNVYDDYICASILNTTEGYTPAYTLKGICVQLLSFFSSDTIEQDHGGVVNRRDYAARVESDPCDCSTCRGSSGRSSPRCSKCGFGVVPQTPAAARTLATGVNSLALRPRTSTAQQEPTQETMSATSEASEEAKPEQKLHLIDLPSEVLLLICECLPDEELSLATRAWNGFRRLLHTHNVIAVREMQCFTLKEGFKECSLGVGVHVYKRTISSEFDFLSKEAFGQLGVRRSVQGLTFEHWLPLPLSETHWKRVRSRTEEALNGIGRSASVQGQLVNVLYAFMNDVVVKLSQAASEAEQGRSSSMYGLYGAETKSTLTHASEKAVESYFQLYHLLVVLATDQPSIAKDANNRIARFLDGERDKQACPNLGHLLVALLISDTTNSEELTKAIIKEAVTRNVVWMLDGRGAGMAELSYMEPSDTSDYRLLKTYEASKTSYNLLMFGNLMRRAVQHTQGPASSVGPGATPKPLQKLRDELFTRHGAPPHGAAARLASEIRRIQQVSSFPQFLKAMGVPIPPKAEFTRFLRRAVYESVDKGYSKWAMSQAEALAVRLRCEPGVEVAQGMQPVERPRGHYTFFPQEQRRGGGGGRR